MPVTLDAGMIVKAQVICFETANTSQISINTTYWLVGVQTGTASFTAVDFAEDFDGRMGPQYKGIMANLASYRGVRAQVFRPTPVQAAVAVVTNAGVGTAGAAMAPPQTSFVLSLYTEDAKIRGRQYLPFPANASMDNNGTPTQAYMDDVEFIKGVFTEPYTIIKGASSLPFAPVIYSPARAANPTHDPPLPAVSEKFSLVTRVAYRDGFGTQRRRGFYGRVNGLPI